MRKFVIFVLTFVSVLILSAQNISVTDFRLDEMDLTANQHGTTVLDQNGEKCALIKVKTTQTGFSFDAGSLGVSKTLQKTAEIWVYVPHGVRKLSVSHQKFGSLEYALPVTTQKAKTYIMELKAETPLPVNSQRLTIKCTPQNAVVMIDGEPLELYEGSGIFNMELGSHHYKVVANGYEYEEGTIMLKESSSSKLVVELTPQKMTEDKHNEISSFSEDIDIKLTGDEFVDMFCETICSLYDVKLGETSFVDLCKEYMGKVKKIPSLEYFCIRDDTDFCNYDNNDDIDAITINAKKTEKILPDKIKRYVDWDSRQLDWEKYLESHGAKLEPYSKRGKNIKGNKYFMTIIFDKKSSNMRLEHMSIKRMMNTFTEQ